MRPTISRSSQVHTVLSLAHSSESRPVQKHNIDLAPLPCDSTAICSAASCFASGDSMGVLRRCTSMIAWRPGASGSGTTTLRLMRPGRNRAGSNTSGRLVAASSSTPEAAGCSGSAHASDMSEQQGAQAQHMRTIPVNDRSEQQGAQAQNVRTIGVKTTLVQHNDFMHFDCPSKILSPTNPLFVNNKKGVAQPIHCS
jgi:hypothetical protein